MIPLNLPAYEIKIVHSKDRPTIFDFLRHRYVALTPEEWVRQHFTHYLVEHKHYPAALLANEVSLDIGGSLRRCDSILYHRDGGRPRLIIEYKAPHIPVTQQIFNQISSYNSVLRAEYLIVTNGIDHYCCRMDYEHRSFKYIPKIPDYSEL